MCLRVCVCVDMCIHVLCNNLTFFCSMVYASMGTNASSSISSFMCSDIGKATRKDVSSDKTETSNEKSVVGLQISRAEH